MTEAEATAREETEKSIHAIRKIDELRESPSFQTYVGGIERKAAEMANRILEGLMSPEGRDQLRIERLGLLSGLRMLESDREGHASILRGHGIDV